MPKDSTVMNYDKARSYQAQPMFGAGSARAITFLHRDEGETVNSSILLTESDTVNESDSYVVLGANTQAIAGTTFYQSNAQLVIFGNKQ